MEQWQGLEIPRGHFTKKRYFVKLRKNESTGLPMEDRPPRGPGWGEKAKTVPKAPAKRAGGYGKGR